MKKISGIYLLIAVIILFTSADSSTAAVRRILGPNATMSWASSYLAIQSNSVTVQDNTSWTYATAPGWFFDYLVTPYISLRSNWFFYPSSLNNNYKSFDKTSGQIPLHEVGFSVLRHFNVEPFNPWFGAGPFMQFATIDDINSYIVHAVLSVGFDYEITDYIYFCPEFMVGIGARIISRSEENNVVIDVPTGKGFSSSGIVIFIKLGVGKAF
jgi:hypothetical protein